MAKRLKDVPNLPFAPIVAALFGLVAAALVFATPAWLLSRVVDSLGVSGVISAARPPLGDTARLIIAVVIGIGTALALWLVLRPIEKIIHSRRIAKPKFAGVDTSKGTKNPKEANAGAEDVMARRTRAPIFAEQELGAPLMSDAALASGEEFFLDRAMVDPLPLGKSMPVRTINSSEEPNIVREAPISENPSILEESAPPDTLPMPEVELTETISAVETPQTIENLWPTTANEVPPEKILVEAVTFESVPDEEINGWVAAASQAPATQPEVLAEIPLAVAVSEVPQAASQAEPVAVTEATARASMDKGEPSLRELVERLDTALQKRAAKAGKTAMPTEGNIASLRSLLAGGR